MKNTTLDALAQFSQSEKDLRRAVFPKSEGVSEDSAPSEHTIQNVLNYSKALSVRKSRQVSDMFFVLN